MSDRLTTEDIRKAGFCMNGARRHCTTLGLDFRKLVREGLPLNEMEEINDGNVQRSVAVAKERIAADGQQ